MARSRGDSLDRSIETGQMLLTRLVREPGDPESPLAVLAGPCCSCRRRMRGRCMKRPVTNAGEMEVVGGSFELGDWPEFAKRFGHILLRNFARMRFAALVEAVGKSGIGRPRVCPFYVMALYEHHEYIFIAGGMAELEGGGRSRRSAST